MNVFIVGSPLETAKALDRSRFNKQIIECGQIIDALKGKGAWSNHPCTLQYKDHKDWLENYRCCLICYRNGNMAEARFINFLCQQHTPPFHTQEYFNQMKRRLYTKSPEHYAQWAELGESDENWYWSPSEQKIIKYINGKRIKE